MSSHADFNLHHEALEEARRLLTHPTRELERLERNAAEGASAASLLVIVVGVFGGVWAIAALVYALVLGVSRLVV